MKSINYLILFVFSLVITCYACKKDSSSSLTPKEMVTAHSWKLSSMKINNVESLEDCSKDDILIFSANGSYTYNAGSITCYTGETSYSGTWSVTEDGKSMVVDGESASCVITENKIVVTTTYGTETTITTLTPA